MLGQQEPSAEEAEWKDESMDEVVTRLESLQVIVIIMFLILELWFFDS